MIGAFLLPATVIVLAVTPLAVAPGLLNTDIPGVSVIEQFAAAAAASPRSSASASR